jgi:hypothetical protein
VTWKQCASATRVVFLWWEYHESAVGRAGSNEAQALPRDCARRSTLRSEVKPTDPHLTKHRYAGQRITHLADQISRLVAKPALSVRIRAAFLSLKIAKV